MADSPNPLDSETLATDWITIWQSEWAAAAVDREMQEAWLRMMAQQAGEMQAGATPFPQAPADAAPGSARPVAPARASSVADAPDARDAASVSLLDRVAELERRAANPAGG